MNSQFFEFWGQLLMNASRGQKQIEDLHNWMQQGFSGYEALNAMFRKAYGLGDVKKEDDPDYLKLWKKSMADFQESFHSYLYLFDVVPKEEHLSLIVKYEELKKKSADQEETVKNLRTLLGEKMTDQGQVVEGFRDLMEKQTDEFQALMKHMSQFFQKEKPAKKKAKLTS